MRGALEGIRIIDTSRVLAGPFCSMILGDLGAEVIKIEHVRDGDETRSWGPPFVGSESAYYLTANRNKRGMTLDLGSEKGKEIFLELVADADVMIENFKVGTLAKWGLSYDDLSQHNEGIIVASITGFGQTGPYQALPGYDYIVQAMSGLMSITGEKEGPPLKVGVAISDVLTGLYTCIGILSAVHHRQQTGEGQAIDISLLDCQVSALVNVASNYLATGDMPTRLGNQHPNISPYQVFSAKDGDMVIAVGNDRQFEQFAHVIEKPELLDVPLFQTNTMRVENRTRLLSVCGEAMLAKTKREWKALFDQAGVPNGPIQTIPEMFADPHIQAREMCMSMEHPSLGALKLVGSPLKLSKSPVKMIKPPPLYGEHTEQVLRELGYTKDDIEGFRQNHII
ncbi:CoA transferase [Alkalihalobacillus sp. LMS6]|uniref:CaiB/BaiF CoA transferase family protein n=1 Tax=Bacillaceae TaxID=186817 RepID=UPI000C073350|nr:MULTISPECIES: CaiB/BaiF CoA-transferase family protein [Bacillaceae]UTR07128.1 CoA transferase [Alkalihalobacillus sp. LMS6]